MPEMRMSSAGGSGTALDAAGGGGGSPRGGGGHVVGSSDSWRISNAMAAPAGAYAVDMDMGVADEEGSGRAAAHGAR
eukprot:364599-Chlamydomonas_euryale.AAC.25